MEPSTTGKYLEGLPSVEKNRYVRKLKCLYGGPCVDKYEDPYQIKDEFWIDDVSKWPPVEFPALYMYFIESPGGYTREKLKAYKSLEAYNYYARLIFTVVVMHEYFMFLYILVAGYVQCTFMLLEIKSTAF